MFVTKSQDDIEDYLQKYFFNFYYDIIFNCDSQ